MSPGAWVVIILGAHVAALVGLIWYRYRHPGCRSAPMTQEEWDDFLDDLLFPPFTDWGNDDDSEDE